jgi:tRNA A37 threonylcarbamoyladenosine dehydratase
MLYEECYKRNIGLFTEAEQNKLKEAKIVVAGVGGVGGIEVATLAKMGVCNFVIFDPGEFDPPDMNRQLAATVSNMEKNKALATKQMLLEINPFAKVEALSYAPDSDEELDDLLKNATIAIDAIDYIGFDYKVRFAQAVRRAGIYNFTAPIVGMTTSVFIFDPKGMTLEEFYLASKDKKEWNAYKIPLDKVMYQGSATHLTQDFGR